MQLELKQITYASLNARQKENYNYAKISALLADFGFVTMRLSDDWQNADFIAFKPDDDRQFLKVQLKSRLSFGRKYGKKDLYVAFRDGENWYLYPHDLLLEQVLRKTTVRGTKSWSERGGYSFPRVSKQLRKMLEPYLVKPPSRKRSGSSKATRA